MKPMNVFERLMTEKFWGRKDGITLMMFVVLNPILLALLGFLLGFQFFCGIIFAIAAAIVLKTKWSK